MLRGNTESVDISDLSDIEESIYEKRCDTSIYHGISSGNNLVMILAESFEWYPLTIYSKEQTAKIYPNLSKLMEESILCDNFYSREKTDTAESLMIVGSNPTGKYTHNDFADNSYPYSLPNLYRQQALTEGDDDVIIKSYHQNKGSFYNRNNAHKSFGFDDLVDVDDMKKFGVVNTWDSQKRERTLDSLTMNAMKNEMFPSDQRFFTYWITFSTHGFYHERENLKEYYELFDRLGVFPKGNQYENYLRTYAAAVADLDKAIGIMLDDLNRKQLLENTTIAIIADHNTYYNSLSNYAKDIDTQYNPELYRVPVILYDQKLIEAMDKAGDSRIITKFTTTSDIVPTLLDLLGIPAWDNLYLGSTIFNKERESIIYSRAYNIFINEQYIGYSLNDLKYEAPSSTTLTKSEFEAKALAHLNKLEIIDKIFYSDYFSEYRYRP
jgi:phosphoglycerol transferase MdoB-like AlkP superfamily enzyme